MTKNALKLVKSDMAALNLNYAFMQFNSEPNYPYFVGDYTEVEPLYEDGMLESAFHLTGFSRSTWMELENAKTAIEAYYTKFGTARLMENGSAVVIIYAGAQVIPTGDADLKKIQINLIIKEWMVT